MKPAPIRPLVGYIAPVAPDAYTYGDVLRAIRAWLARVTSGGR